MSPTLHVHPEMTAHNSQFPRSHMRLGRHLHGFIGYAASNVYVIEGDMALCVVDTTESTGAAAAILADLRKLTDKPIAQIVYTHSHRDHICGASVFAQGGSPEIIAWHGFASDIVGEVSGMQKVIAKRTGAQFGVGLSFPVERVNLGCGPGDRPTEGLGEGHIAPTVLVKDPALRKSLAGVSAQLLHIPGETPDHMLVWLQDERLLISGDNFYHAFPNLSPLRGTPYRDFALWADGLDQMAALSPQILCPGHTLPVEGEAAIAERLTSTAQAIRYVMEITEQGLMAGLPLDQIVAGAELPEGLAQKPWLAPFYGRLDWAIRAYAAGALGWFDGAAINIARLVPREEAARFVDLAGGVDTVRQAAEETDDPQWSLELAERLHVLGHEAADLRKAALFALAEQQINPTARNYYLTAAKAIEATEP